MGIWEVVNHGPSPGDRQPFSRGQTGAQGPVLGASHNDGPITTPISV